MGTDDTTFFKRGDTAQGRVTPEGSFRVMKGQWAACNLTVFAGYFTLVL